MTTFIERCSTRDSRTGATRSVVEGDRAWGSNLAVLAEGSLKCTGCSETFVLPLEEHCVYTTGDLDRSAPNLWESPAFHRVLRRRAWLGTLPGSGPWTRRRCSHWIRMARFLPAS